MVPKDEYTSVLKPGEKVSIKYSTDQFETSLVLNYMDSTGKVEPIVLSEYVKKHEQGTVVLKMVQSDDNEVKFQITDNIK